MSCTKFAAAQAAQKLSNKAPARASPFAAAQAAQKGAVQALRARREFAAAQAAQKWQGRLYRCCSWFAAAQAAQKGEQHFADGSLPPIPVQTGAHMDPNAARRNSLASGHGSCQIADNQQFLIQVVAS